MRVVGFEGEGAAGRGVGRCGGGGGRGGWGFFGASGLGFADVVFGCYACLYRYM